MSLFAPDYYTQFYCIADRCRHSCCIGWEIDIDEDTLEYYGTIDGEIGERLKKDIIHKDGTACFALGENERCCFLNKNGLCDIITALGEQALCQIYDDHPRYRNFYSDRTEIGVGLCCEADADITFDGTTAVTTRQGDYNVTTTSHYDIFRSGRVPFKNIPIDASKNMPDNLMDSIEPFDYDQLEPFSLSYLPGYMAERYGLEPQQCFQRMELRAENSTVDLLQNDVIGFAGCSVKHKNIRITNGKVKYALLPVYMLTTKYKGEDYLFAMNGQSGKLIGNLPVCKKKFWAHFIGITAGITAVVGTAMMLFM